MGGRVMAGHELTSSTYIEPLEREQPVLTLLTVGIEKPVRDGIRDALATDFDAVTVLVEESTSDALDRLATDGETVDCVVGDDCQETDGIGLLRRIRDVHGQVPFVFCLDAGSEVDAIEAINAGADGYFRSDDAGAQYEQLVDRISTVVDDHRSRTKLAETTRLLSRLTEYTTDTLWMFTGDWEETVVVNSAYEDIWDRSMADLIEDPGDFLEGVYPPDRDIVTDGMATLSGGEPANLEYRIKTDSDDEHWLSVHAEPVFDSDGNIEYVAGYTRDISDLKNREQSIRSLNEATTELLHARNRKEVGAVVIDIVDSVIGRSVVTVRTAHTETEELVPLAATADALDAVGGDSIDALATVPAGTGLYDLFERDESTLVDEDETARIMPQTTDIGELLVVPVGEYGILSVGTEPGRPFEPFERSLLEILGRTATAALYRVERDAELEAHREELERSNENLQQFAYVASHDLQEPLRMVASYVDLLDSEYSDELDEEASEYMEFAVDGARRMQDMIDALLQYARVQTRAEAFETVDSNQIVDDTLDALRLQIDEADATVTTAPLPTVEADPNQLGQVFQNLLKNAIAYASQSGVTPRVEIDATRSDGLVTFSVTDNGPGIPEHATEDIFEIFKRGGEHDSEGTGIGLAVCRRIVQRHGGEMWAEPQENGAKFMFTIPAKQTEGLSDD